MPMKHLELEEDLLQWQFLLILPLYAPLFLPDDGDVAVYSRPEAEEFQLLT